MYYYRFGTRNRSQIAEMRVSRSTMKSAHLRANRGLSVLGRRLSVGNHQRRCPDKTWEQRNRWSHQTVRPGSGPNCIYLQRSLRVSQKKRRSLLHHCCRHYLPTTDWSHFLQSLHITRRRYPSHLCLTTYRCLR